MNDGGLTMDCEDTQQLLIVDDLVSIFMKLHFFKFCYWPCSGNKLELCSSLENLLQPSLRLEIIRCRGFEGLHL